MAFAFTACERAGGNLKSQWISGRALRRLEGGRDILRSPNFESNNIEANRAGRFLVMLVGAEPMQAGLGGVEHLVQRRIVILADPHHSPATRTQSFAGGDGTRRDGVPPRVQTGFEGIVSKRKDSSYRSGRSPDWLKMKNPACEAVTREEEREEEEAWGRR